MENNQQKLSNEEARKWITIGCVALGAIATTTIYAGQKILKGDGGLFRIENRRKVYDVFMGPGGGLYRVVNDLKRYDVAGKVFSCFCN